MNEQPVSVVAYLDALIASHKSLSADAYHAQELPKAEAVRAAVAALIEYVELARDTLEHTSSRMALREMRTNEVDGMAERAARLLARCGGAA